MAIAFVRMGRTQLHVACFCAPVIYSTRSNFFVGLLKSTKRFSKVTMAVVENAPGVSVPEATNLGATRGRFGARLACRWMAPVLRELHSECSAVAQANSSWALQEHPAAHYALSSLVMGVSSSQPIPSSQDTRLDSHTTASGATPNLVKRTPRYSKY